MSNYIGVVFLKKTISCEKSISGMHVKSKIAGREVTIVFPSIPENYTPQMSPNIQSGDLVAPYDLFKGKVNWGTINQWPQGLFSVQNLLLYASGNDADIHEVYADFPRWSEKLNNLLLIDTGDYIVPEQKIPALLREGGFDDGLQVFEAVEGQPSRYIRNTRTIEPIMVHFIETKEVYTSRKIIDLFSHAGSPKEIALAYELLITAYNALERHDFRSAVILAGSALEQAILKRMRQEYPSNTKFNKAKNSKQHAMLKGRFNWLAEKNINIPVVDYKKSIIDVRNDAAHDGICPTCSEAKQCLEKCKVLVEAYNPSVLG